MSDDPNPKHPLVKFAGDAIDTVEPHPMTATEYTAADHPEGERRPYKTTAPIFDGVRKLAAGVIQWLLPHEVGPHHVPVEDDASAAQQPAAQPVEIPEDIGDQHHTTRIALANKILPEGETVSSAADADKVIAEEKSRREAEGSQS